MSGTVPPPPPPGPAPQGPGADSPQEPVRPASAAATAATPPSFAPGSAPQAGGAGSPSPAPAPAPPTAVQQPTASPHAPVPPAPTQRQPAGPAPTSPAPTSPAPTSPAPAGYSAPVRQPAYQPAAYRQPEYHQPAYQQPPAPLAASQQYGYTPQQYAYQQPSPPTGTAQAPAAAGSAKRPSRRLSPGWIVFIVVDVILIVVAVTFAINMLGGSDVPTVADAEPDAVATQDAQDGAEGEGAEEEPAADPGASVAEFASPSRNISCEVFENQVSCAIAELNQQPAPVEGCDGTTGYVVTLGGDGEVALPCVPGADKPTAAAGGLDELPYGESTTEGDFTCTSEQDGMYCQHDPSGKGFSLARAGVGTY
ncbi:hypothetical protein UQW22_17385 [Isoptericola halotolerans]|uniref:hypothetical protein n=1 Tax=Isoptericola halotolerans TaxID=300560 RepID=UPI00388DD0B7